MITTVPLASDYGRPANPSWRDVGWAARAHDATVAGRSLHYVDYGSGPLALILVHGLGGRWQHWLENIPALAWRGRVLAVDLPGFGKSQPPRDGYSLDGFADVSAELCRDLGVTRAVLVGHSLGSSVALRFAARHPGLATGIVLAAGPVVTFSGALAGVPGLLRRQPRSLAATYFEVLTSAIPAPRPLRRVVGGTPALRKALLWPYLRDPVSLPADLIDVLVGGAGARGLLPTARAVGRSDPLAGLDDVRCPMLAIGGADDLLVPPADVARFACDAPDADVVMLEGCGHMVMMERARAFNLEVGRFVDSLA